MSILSHKLQYRQSFRVKGVAPKQAYWIIFAKYIDQLKKKQCMRRTVGNALMDQMGYANNRPMAGLSK